MLKTSRRIIFFLLLLLGYQVFGEEYYLRPRVVTGEDPLTLGAFLVQIGGADGSVLSRPFELPVKNPAVIPASTFREILAPVRQENYILVGNRTVFIPGGQPEAEKGGFPLELLEALASRVENPGAWCEFTVRNFPDAEPFSEGGSFSLEKEGNDSFSVTFSSPAGEKSGVPGERRELHFTVDLHRYVSSLTAAGNMPPSTLLTTQNTGKGYFPADSLRKQPIHPDELADGLETSVYVPSGSPLHRGNTEKEKLIRSGSRITISMKRGAVIFRLQGIAYGQGGKGDNIRVKPIHSQKSFYGIVRSSQEVQVEDF